MGTRAPEALCAESHAKGAIKSVPIARYFGTKIEEAKTVAAGMRIEFDDKGWLAIV